MIRGGPLRPCTCTVVLHGRLSAIIVLLRLGKQPGFSPHLSEMSRFLHASHTSSIDVTLVPFVPIYHIFINPRHLALFIPIALEVRMKA
jgi:hypothetical protein